MHGLANPKSSKVSLCALNCYMFQPTMWPLSGMSVHRLGGIKAQNEFIEVLEPICRCNYNHKNKRFKNIDSYCSMVIRLPHGWLTHAGVHFACKLISVYLCAYAGTSIVYISIMPGLLIVQRLYSDCLEILCFLSNLIHFYFSFYIYNFLQLFSTCFGPAGPSSGESNYTCSIWHLSLIRCYLVRGRWC